MSSAVRRAAAVLALLSAAVFIQCSQDSPTAPRPLDLVLDYGGPTALPVEPAEAKACMEYWAPVHLDLSTDWIFSATLQPRANGHYGLTLQDVPAGTHWLVLYDTRLCALNPLAPPIATLGIMLGGVALSRETTTPGGAKALAFTVDGFGRVRP